MTDRPENGSGAGEDTVAHIHSARTQLEPLLTAVLDALAVDAQSEIVHRAHARPMSTGAFFAAAGYLTELRARLQAADTRPGLLHLFLDISLIGFQGYTSSPNTAAALDRLRETCATIALAMTAGGESAH